MSGHAQALVEALQAARRSPIVVTTGAGISLASGIPTFRGQDPGAVWKRDVTELGTLRYFREDPAGSWRWYMSRFERVRAARPNPAHQALVALQAWQRAAGGDFLLVTQNIDTLHEQAGSRDFVKVHGSVDRVRCARDGCRLGAPTGSLARAEVNLDAFARDPVVGNLPRCPACGALLRQHVLWFDECYDGHADYQWDRVRAAAANAELFVFVGTSFSVGVTDLLLESALARCVPVFSIDPHTPPPVPGVIAVRAPSETLLPEVLHGPGGLMTKHAN
jgi:NAD-dependent deacetylase